MAYENKSLKDLMDEICKTQPKSETYPPAIDEDINEVDFLDDLFQPLDLDTCVRDTLSELAPYRLTEAEQNTIREFLTFRIRTRQDTAHPEANITYYNLLLHSDEKESIRAVADILRKALNIAPGQTLLRTEAELLQKQQESNNSRAVRRTSEPLIPVRTRLLLIDQCQDAPRINMEAGSAIRDTNRKAMDSHQLLWRTVINHIRANPGTILLVGCDEDVYRSTMRPFVEISQRLCAHHIYIAPQTQEDLLEQCLSQLKKSSFRLDKDFETALTKYFQDAYRISDLRSKDFVMDVIERIFARYYSQKRDSDVLTADCVPEFDWHSQSAEAVLEQLEQLVGLETVKKEFRNIFKMQAAGINDPKTSYYHMLFSGNPGTGKTTVARMAADLFFRMGVTKTNKLVAVKPSDLISEWIGGTGMKAMEVIRRAYNGVLFIDEAYGIANMDRGEELLNVLLQEMENNGHKLIVILAGYTDEMRELLKSNPGLGSRISQELHFDDYTQEELTQIFLQMCKKAGFSMDPNARDELDDCISALKTREFFGNARDIRNMLQDLKEVWSQDYYTQVTEKGADPERVPRVFRPQHFEKIMPPKKEVSIRDLIGLEVLKNKLEVFKRQALYQKYLREKGFQDLTDFSMHMIFTGNPGTGKSTVAKLIADDLYSIGMLKTNRLVVAERKDLIGIHGDTGKKTADIIRKAVGGVLFIDEAYSLTGDRYGNNDCIEVLLTAMEEHKSDTVFIFAGYVDQMEAFLASNPGIQSRIGYTFHFADYAPEDLTAMYADKMKKAGFVVSKKALEQVRQIMEYFRDVKYFGNGRFVNHVIHQTISQRAGRDFMKDYRDIEPQDIPSFKTLIETAPNSMRLYDPAAVTEEHQRRTAIHELGHALVMVALDPENLPESISIRGRAGSYGRVKLNPWQDNQTEEQLLHHIATLLGGKNGEKLLLGNHDTGCASDYAWAKSVAADMVEKYAMTTYGADAAAILAAADKLSEETLRKQQTRLEELLPLLLQDKDLPGTILKET